MEGVEMVALRVHGQSFMLNQIRKMVGAAVEIVRSGALGVSGSEEGSKESGGDGDGEGRKANARRIFAKMTDREKYAVPTAPAEGLFLDLCCFPGYDARYATKVCGLAWRPPFACIEMRFDETSRTYRLTNQFIDHPID